MSIITIEVHAFVKKVLIKEFGEEPIFAGQNNLIGIMIRPLLTDKYNIKGGKFTGNINESLKIMLPARLKHLTHNKHEDQVLFLEDFQISKIKYSLKKFVEYLIISNIMILKNGGKTTMQAFRQIYIDYDLNEDILPTELLMSIYARHKKALLKSYYTRIKEKKIK
jgi:hypothetical protein